MDYPQPAALRERERLKRGERHGPRADFAAVPPFRCAGHLPRRRLPGRPMAARADQLWSQPAP